MEAVQVCAEPEKPGKAGVEGERGKRAAGMGRVEGRWWAGQKESKDLEMREAAVEAIDGGDSWPEKSTSEEVSAWAADRWTQRVRWEEAQYEDYKKYLSLGLGLRKIQIFIYLFIILEGCGGLGLATLYVIM